MITGNCLCGGVAYEYAGELTELVICHCNMCKRAQGTPFATNAPIERAAFRVLKGENLLRSYASSENKQRVFCSQCGSPLYSQRTDLPEILRLRVGTVTSGHIPEPAYQIFCDSAAAWLPLEIDCPRYPGRNV
jgi:hypothetical protein